MANYHLGLAYQEQGDYRRATDCLAVALDGPRRYERVGQLFLRGVLPRAILAACCHAELGTFADGHVAGEEGL
jgi:hypothetical protein